MPRWAAGGRAAGWNLDISLWVRENWSLSETLTAFNMLLSWEAACDLVSVCRKPVFSLVCFHLSQCVFVDGTVKDWGRHRKLGQKGHSARFMAQVTALREAGAKRGQSRTNHMLNGDIGLENNPTCQHLADGGKGHFIKIFSLSWQSASQGNTQTEWASSLQLK